MKTWIKNSFSTAAVATVALGTAWAVQHYHQPGQLDVLTAQAMDMSQMRPPTGAAPVALVSARQGTVADTVTYTGTVLAYNEQDISPRIAGILVSLPVYPGQTVRAGEVVAQLDTSGVGPQAAQADALARQAQSGTEVAEVTHRLRSSAAEAQASAQVEVARQGVTEALADVSASEAAITDLRAGVQSAQAQAEYWKTEIGREKQIADAGAVSQQEYQNEQASAQSAGAALIQAQAKESAARAAVQAAHSKVRSAERQVTAAQAGRQLAEADSAVALGQVIQAQAGSAAANAAARAAAVQQSYARLTAPLGGIVTARLAAPGTLVQPGTVILKIAEIDRVRVQANVAVSDIATVRVGSPVALTVQGETLRARVSSVFPAADSQTRTAVVEAILPNPGHRLLPGAFVTMQITKSSALDVLLVPASAIVSQGGRSFVWTARGGAGSQVYECTVCHMHYSAADAKKYGYKDPMDGGKLVLVPGAQPAAGLTAHEVVVRTGKSDGTWTEVSADALAAGTEVVAHGQAGLTDGVQMTAAAWGADGPLSLPSASIADGGRTVYRCEKCGMTYSAAEAKKHGYVDPMDGGKLVRVEGSAQ